MYGEHALSANITFDKEKWDIEDSEWNDEFKKAVQAVREHHEKEIVVDADALYKLRVRWNGKTDEVRFDVYAISETFIVKEGQIDG